MANTTFFSESSKRASHLAPIASLGRGIASFFGSVNRAMMINSAAHQRLKQVESLNAKTDAELAALGLERNDIVRHAFGDLFWS